MTMKVFMSSCIILSVGLLAGCQHMSSYDDYNSYTSDSAYKQQKPQRVIQNMPSSRPATGAKVFVFSPKKLMWGAYDADGNLIKEGIASGGQGWCSDIRRPCRTPSGSYRVTRKGDGGCKSNKYPLGKGGAPMPHCMYFKGGYAIHGSYDVPARNASHGCVRVKPSSAAWLSENFMNVGTKVIVEPYH